MFEILQTSVLALLLGIGLYIPTFLVWRRKASYCVVGAIFCALMIFYHWQIAVVMALLGHILIALIVYQYDIKIVVGKRRKE